MVEIFQFLIDQTVLISAIIRTDMGSQHHGQNEIQNSFGGVDQLVLISIRHVYLTEDSSQKPNAATDHNIAPRAGYVILQVNIQK